MTRNLRLLALILASACVSMAHGFQSYSINGSGNNIANPDWGQADTQLLRLTPSAYDDGLSTPRGGDPSSLPSARAISNAVGSQTTSVVNSVNASDWLWQWGQFLDHDLDLTGGASPAEPFNVPVPLGDPSFDPFNTGTQEISLHRSAHVTDGGGVRQQINQITAYIDGSSVYGSNLTRAADLRLGSGGLLRSTIGNNGEVLLPLNDNLLPNANDAGIFPDNQLFIAGDVRANEQVGLTAAHTLFLREHNRIAGDLANRISLGEVDLIQKRDTLINESGNGIDNDDDFLYESARKVVAAQLQKITYEEFLPVLLGDSAMSPYAGYDDTANAGISNEFSTAAYRVGHTMLSTTLLRRNSNGTTALGGDVPLQMAFFNPQEVKDNGIDSLLMGLTLQRAQNVDTLVIDDVRNFLFGPPGSGGLDLVSLNIQRGRDHGLDTLNNVRSSLGLSPHTSFLDLTGGDSPLASMFASVYSTIDDVDLWIGGLAETHFGNSVLGETFYKIILDQFTRSRDGDRLFYLTQLEHIEVLDPNFSSTLLSDIILRNTGLTNIRSNVFTIPEPSAAVLILGATYALLALRASRQA